MVETQKVNHGLVHVCRDSAELGDVVAREFLRIVQDAISKRGRCAVALSGGHTPQILYERLMRDDLKNSTDWSKVHFFVSDERCVPQESNDNNFGNAMRQFLSRINIPETNLHPTRGQEKDAKASALDYEKQIREFFGAHEGQTPQFDAILLGMGPDGHCASLFPGTTALAETSSFVVSNHVDKLNADRITFTFPALNAARSIIFMIEGAEKAPVLAEALQSSTHTYPVQSVVPKNGRLDWFVDEAAARELKVRS